MKLNLMDQIKFEFPLNVINLNVGIVYQIAMEEIVLKYCKVVCVLAFLDWRHLEGDSVGGIDTDRSS